ncbi:hypothetical protein LPJ66_001582 [Kickxella alabastrina]|uniref:Uncharacterized protein n=1 Tax=Kickxella alabastrina TaxID=61397 RepID=A0ACC1ISW4_9FUNG|nr:hypothetical protein LPJ66_001582 [Kickxella alabastrina]
MALTFSSLFALSGLFTFSIAVSIGDAVVDERAYGKMYDIFLKQPDAASEVFEFVMHVVMNKPPKEQTKLRDRLISRSNNTLGVEDNGDADIVKTLGYLSTLHGIVWTFPRDMATVLQDPETNIRIMRVISSIYLPLVIRETLLCMVSNWCILYNEHLGTRRNLESVVDSVKVKHGMRPNGTMLPDPPYTRGQPNWPYPTTGNQSARINEQQYQQPQHQQLFASTPVMPPRQQQQLNLNPQYANSFGRHVEIDPVFASQQNEISKSQSFSSHHAPNYCRSPLSVPELPLPLTPTDAAENKHLAPEFVAHMNASANEFKSICDMLTETLISLDVAEDPGTNSVVQDMIAEIKQRKTSLFNFMDILTPDKDMMLAKLKNTVANTDRCLWLYDKSINAHNVWKTTVQEKHNAPVVKETRQCILEGAVRSAGSVNSFLNYSGDCQPGSSKTRAKLIAAAFSDSSAPAGTVSAPSFSKSNSSSSIVLAENLPNKVAPLRTLPAIERMSSKARGKMAEDPLQSTETGAEWDYYKANDSAYGGSAENHTNSY